MFKIALYTCNFGNYRNEFEKFYNYSNLDNFDLNIDYFLYTDKDKYNKLSNTKSLFNVF